MFWLNVVGARAFPEFLRALVVVLQRRGDD